MTAGPPRLARPLIVLSQVRTASNALTAILGEEYGNARLFHLTSGDHRDPTAFEGFQRDARAEGHEIYAGHFLFGVHRHLPGPADYATTVRDPVDRVWSMFLAAGKGLDVPLDFDRWLAGFFEARDGMVKRLNGFGLIPGRPEVHDAATGRVMETVPTVGPDHLARALDNIEAHIPLVLLFGRQAENLVLLREHLGCGPLFSLGRQHVNQSGAARHRPTPAQAQAIEAANPLDRQLYEACRARFQARIAARDPAFRDEVRIMTLVNGVLSEPGLDTMDPARLFQRLMALTGELFRRGDQATAIEVLHRFSSKHGVGEDFCRGVLKLVRDFGCVEAVEREERVFRGKFGGMVKGC